MGQALVFDPLTSLRILGPKEDFILKLSHSITFILTIAKFQRPEIYIYVVTENCHRLQAEISQP